MLRFLIFVVGVMAAGTSMAEEVSQCPVDSVPIQPVGWYPYGDAGYGPRITLSDATRKRGNINPYFPTPMEAITKHVAARLGRENLCLDNAESKERSLLQFVTLTIVPLPDGKKPLTPLPSLDVRPSGGCRITSPWIDIAIERKPVPWIRAVVRWSERQFLADQAMLAGVQNVPLGVAKQLTLSELRHFDRAALDRAQLTPIDFRHFAMVYEKYESAEIKIPPSGYPTEKPIEEIVPGDILWQARNKSTGPIPYFGVVPPDLPSTIMEKGEEGYTKLVFALIDRCFASDGEEFHYDSILDVSKLISLEQYKIIRPFRSKQFEREAEKLCARYKDKGDKHTAWCDVLD